MTFLEVALIATLVSACGLALLAWVFYKVRGLHKKRRVVRLANSVIASVDAPFREDLDEVVAPQRAPPGVLGNRVRFRPRRGRVMAQALADGARYKFGQRPQNPANLLITRKWMFDELSVYKDLRAADGADIIDAALYASFLPSKVLRDMNEVLETDVYRSRALLVPERVGFWRWLFPGVAWLIDLVRGGRGLPSPGVMAGTT
jgi:hypothetical protein